MNTKLTTAAIALALGLGLGAPAHAADVSVVDAGYDWTGFYVGLQGGYGTLSSDWNNIYGTYEGGPTDVSKGQLANINEGGLMGGVTAGYNFMLSDRFLLGLEGDWSWGSLNGTDSCMGDQGYGADCSSDLKWVGTVAARAGFTVDRSLFFVKGGVAFGGFDFDVGHFRGFDAPDYKTESETRTGWIVGAGIEQAVFDNLSVKLEGDYMNFGEDKVNFSSGCGSSCESANFGSKIDAQVWEVKAGINYRF